MFTQFIYLIIIFMLIIGIDLKLEKTFSKYFAGALSLVFSIGVFGYFAYLQDGGIWKFLNDSNTIWSIILSFGFGIITGLITTKVIERATKKFTLVNMYIEEWRSILRKIESIRLKLMSMCLSENGYIQYVHEILLDINEMDVSLRQIKSYYKKRTKKNSNYLDSIKDFDKYMNGEVSDEERDELLKKLSKKDLKLVDKNSSASLFYYVYLTEAINIVGKEKKVNIQDQMLREIISHFIRNLNIELQVYMRDLYCEKCKVDKNYSTKCINTLMMKSKECDEFTKRHNNIIHNDLKDGFFILDENIISDYLTYISKIKLPLASLIEKLKKGNYKISDR